MSPTPSPTASNTIRSAISLTIALSVAIAGAACTRELLPPKAAIAAPTVWHVGVAVQLDGSGSLAYARQAPLATPALHFHWSFTSVPALSAARINDAALAKPSFVPDVAGNYGVQLVVDDGVLPSGPATASIDVKNDCAPVITVFSPSPKTPGVGQTVSLSATVGAPCAGSAAASDPIVSYRWTLLGAPAGSKAQLLQPGSATAALVPDLRGSYTVSLVVTDALGLSNDPSDPSSQTTITTLSCGDNAPVIASVTATPPSPGTGSVVTLSAAVSDDDVDLCGLSRALTYAWQLTAIPAGSKAALNNPGVKSPSFTPDQPGDFVVALVVSDDLGRKSARKTLTVTSSACGSASPVATAVGPALSPVLVTGAPVQLGVNVHDADNPSLDGLNPTGGVGTPVAGQCAVPLTFSYQWRMVTAPAGSRAQLNNPTLANPSFTGDVPGAYVASVVVTASTGKSSDPSFFTATVDACGSLKPRVLAIVAPAGAITGKPVLLDSTLADDNGCQVPSYRYAWSVLSAPGGSQAALSGQSGGTSAQATPSFTPDLGGPYQIGLRVTDQFGLTSDLKTATVTAGTCNAAPQVISIALAGSLATSATVQLSAVVRDDNDPAIPGSTCTAAVFPLSYAWTLVSQPAGSTAQLNNPATSSPSLALDRTGGYSAVLQMTDSAGNRSLPKQYDFSAGTNCNQPPTFLLAASAPATTNQPVTLSANVTDLNTGGGCSVPVTPYSYAWTFTALPPGSKATLNNAGASNPSFVPDVNSKYTVQLVLTDAAGNKSAPKSIDVVPTADCLSPLVLASIAVKQGAATTSWTPAVPVNVGAGSGQPITFNPSLTDPNAPAAGGCSVATDPVTYLWSLVALPNGSKAALTTRTARTPSFTPDLPGGYSVQFVATDAVGNKSPPAQVDFTVSQCGAPLTFGASPITATAAGSQFVTGNPVTLGLAASNPTDSNTGVAGCGATVPLTYAWSLIAQPPRSLARLDNPLLATPKYVPDVAGAYLAQVTVTDALGNSGTTSASFSASACATSGNLAVTTSAAPAVAELGQPYTLTAQVADTNAPACGLPSVAPFSYVWELTPPGPSFAVLGNPRGAQTNFTPDVTGTYTYKVTVTDAAGASATSNPGSLAGTIDCTLGVANVGQISATSTPAVPQNGFAVPAAGPWPVLSTAVLSVSASSTPVGCATPQYLWSFDTVPAGSATQFDNARVPNPSLVLDTAGSTWGVRVTITDPVTGQSVTRVAPAAPAVGSAVLRTDDCGNAGHIPVAKGRVQGSVAAGATSTNPAAPATPTGFVAPTHNTAAANIGLDGAVAAGNSVAANLGNGGATSACASTVNYKWTLYALPPGSAAAIKPDTAARPVISLDVAGSYVLQLVIGDGLQTSLPAYFQLTAN